MPKCITCKYSFSRIKPLRGVAQPSLKTWTHWRSSCKTGKAGEHFHKRCFSAIWPRGRAFLFGWQENEGRTFYVFTVPICYADLWSWSQISVNLELPYRGVVTRFQIEVIYVNTLGCTLQCTCVVNILCSFFFFHKNSGLAIFFHRMYYLLGWMGQIIGSKLNVQNS